jgi:hypothetical protein
MLPIFLKTITVSRSSVVTSQYDTISTIIRRLKKDLNRLLMNWISESWNNINDNMIKNSFHHCGYSTAGNVDPKWKQFIAPPGIHNLI